MCNAATRTSVSLMWKRGCVAFVDSMPVRVACAKCSPAVTAAKSWRLAISCGLVNVNDEKVACPRRTRRSLS